MDKGFKLVCLICVLNFAKTWQNKYGTHKARELIRLSVDDDLAWPRKYIQWLRGDEIWRRLHETSEEPQNEKHWASVGVAFGAWLNMTKLTSLVAQDLRRMEWDIWRVIGCEALKHNINRSSNKLKYIGDMWKMGCAVS